MNLLAAPPAPHPDEDPNDASRSVSGGGAETRLAPRRKRLPRERERDSRGGRDSDETRRAASESFATKGSCPRPRDPPDAPDAPDPPSGSSTRIIRASFVSSESEPSSELRRDDSSPPAETPSRRSDRRLSRFRLCGDRSPALAEAVALRSRSALLRRCFILSCAALHSTAASNADSLTPSSVICDPVFGSLHRYVRFRHCIFSSGIPHFSRICCMKSSRPSCPVRTLHRNDMSLNLTMMSPFTASIAPLLGD